MKRAHLLIVVLVLILGVFAACSSGGGASNPQSDAKAITAFALYTSPTASSPIAIGTIDEPLKTIAVTVPYGTDVTGLVAGYITTGSSVSVDGVNQVNGTTTQDFTSWKDYVVTAGNGSTATYRVTVTKAPGDAKAITAFALATNATGTVPDAIGVIDEFAKTIAVTVPYATDVKYLVATFITTGVSVTAQGAMQVSGSTHVDFTSPVVYRVLAADTTHVDYTVTVNIASSDAKAITAFYLLGIPGTISEPEKTIAVTVPYGTDVKSLIATYTTTGALVTVGTTTQESGTTANSFTASVDYMVTAADGSTATYIVTVTVASGAEKAITSFLFTSPSATGTINEGAKTIAVIVPSGTDVTSLIATYSTSGAFVSVGTTTQESGTTSNNFTGPVDYLVTALDGSTTTYTVTVTVASGVTGAIKLPKTGQTTCYDTAGAVISCATTSAAGQDGALQKGVAWPNPRFTSNADTSVTDNLTGLDWAPSGNLMPTRDSGWDKDVTDDGMVMWQHALDYVAKLNAESYLGHSDWRLPNRKELKSLINSGQPSLAAWLNTQGFTNAQADKYWSSTTDSYNTFFAWFVNMQNDGTVNNTFNKSNLLYVWPVRSGQGSGAPAELPKTGQTLCYNDSGTVISCATTSAAGQDGALQKGVAWPFPRFTNADNSTPVNGSVVVDRLTGLMWAQDGNTPGPVACTPATGKTWQGALDHVACLNANNYLGYADWRVPDVNELESLVNADRSDTAVWLNAQGFSNVWSNYYWSSTSYTYITDYAWVVYMYTGTVTSEWKANGWFVWPVRGGQ